MRNRQLITDRGSASKETMKDIIKKLPSSLITGGINKRVSGQFTFPTFSFSGYNLRLDIETGPTVTF